MNTDIKTLMQMNIGQIKEHEELMKEYLQKHGDIIDRQKETVASFIEQEKIEEDWAEKFMEDMNIGN